MIDAVHRGHADARSQAGIRARAVVVAGPPASGKTTLGTALAGALHYALLDLDIVTSRMTRAALQLAGADESALQGTLGDRLRDARYGSLLDAAAANLALGMGAVVCAPFTRERSHPEGFPRVIASLACEPAEVALVCLELPESLRHARLSERGAARDGVPGTPAGRRPLDDPEPPPRLRSVDDTTTHCTITLDASRSPDALLTAVLEALTTAPAEPAPPC